MCGIAGIASAHGLLDRSHLEAMGDVLRHRGPDDAGAWWADAGDVGFVHRRLAILDLSPTGHQPMRDSRGDLTIVFNGEIYNFSELRMELEAAGHTFRSASDTEVILEAYRAWDTACVERLNGMFAFALYDHRRRRVLLARDRAGEKPLYCSLVGGVLRFASELKGLLADPAVPRRIDRFALDVYLAMGYVPGERSILEGITKLAPAHAMLFELETGKVRTWAYWTLPPLDSSSEHADEAALLDEMEALLENAVKRQLVADVPVGVLLSGGVDSSLVTAMAVRARPGVKTFTVRFPGHSRFDESAHARRIAEHFGTEHLELDASDADVDLLPVLARQFDEPISDSSMVPTYLLSRLVRTHCTVALGGDGGDELFGGYPLYNRLLWTEARFAAIPRPVRRLVAAAAGVLPVGARGRSWLQTLGTDFAVSLPASATYFDRATRRALMARHGDWATVAEEFWARRVPRATDLLQRATRMDFENYMVADILVKVDRASMLTSLEIRAPLLDHRLVEFAFGRIPSRWKATATARKLLLKKLAARVLPRGFDLERKQGFAIPLGAWLEREPWRGYFRSILLAGDSWFTAGPIRDLLDGQARGRLNSERLFALVIFELWRRAYGVSLG